MFLRLRQLCLVAEKLEPVADDLASLFGIEICHRDPGVGQFGLHNVLLPMGTSFIEIVAPQREGTTAGRYLQRRHGDGGYMVILDTDNLPYWRTHVASVGVRVAAALALDAYEGEQLHPRDTGGALLEINTTRGNSADLMGAYWPAGAHWQPHVRTERVKAVTGAVLQSDDPARLAQRWGQILQRPARRAGNDSLEWRVPVDNATLRFVAMTDGRGEGLAGIDLAVADVPTIINAATARGCTTGASSVQVGGVVFHLTAANAGASRT